MSEDAYSAHMESQHTFPLEEENTFVEPKVEITLTEDENVSQKDIGFKTDIIAVKTDDPLHIVLMEEESCAADAGITTTIMQDDEEYFFEITSGDSSTER